MNISSPIISSLTYPFTLNNNNNYDIRVLSAINTFISPTALSPYPLQPLYNPLYLLNNILPTRSIYYQNVNNDTYLKDQVVAYFWNKLEGWLKYSSKYNDLFSYLVVKNGIVSISKDDLKSSDDKIINIKCDYILNEIIELKDLCKMLEEFILINRVNWWDLKKVENSSYVKNFIHFKIKKYLEKNIK